MLHSVYIYLFIHLIFRGIAVSLLRPVIGSNVEIDVVALNWVADVRKQIAKFAKQITNSTLSSFDSVFSNLLALKFNNIYSVCQYDCGNVIASQYWLAFDRLEFQVLFHS